jgi:SAM-dependent methyltransferase
MTRDPSDLTSIVTARLADLDTEELANTIRASTRGEADVGEVAQTLSMYLNEALVAAEVVGSRLPTSGRVLEVGSGIGYFATILAGAGVDIVELEPVGAGFEFIAAARAALGEHAPTRPRHLAIGVDQLDPAEHGQFELVFSINVLEHVPDWRRALDRMRAVLAPGGLIVHLCPNYAVPYEPHFGVPLVPLRPALTERMLPHRIVDTGLWRSLNWVTAGGVRRWARQRGMEVDFRRGLLADAIERLSTDEEFRRRHQGIVTTCSDALRRARLVELIRKLPPGLTTPMQFELYER